jgi:predicted ATPase
MIKAIHFKNYKALRDTTLPLGRLTVLIGPNGSGKSTALEALQPSGVGLGKKSLTKGVSDETGTEISVSLEWMEQDGARRTTGVWRRKKAGGAEVETRHLNAEGLSCECSSAQAQQLAGARIFSFSASALREPVQLTPQVELGWQGQGLAAVLDRLRDHWPERFDGLNDEFARWIPEFDRILFDTPDPGRRSLSLRTRQQRHVLPLSDISDGTVLGLGLLSLAYLPSPPPIIGLEEPDRGLHPRMMRNVQDAIHRLVFPEGAGEARPPVQVVITTHSPYLLDLFKDRPEDIVIADKTEDNVQFVRLADIPHYEEIISGASLGEIWYSGILGGVPANT